MAHFLSIICRGTERGKGKYCSPHKVFFPVNSSFALMFESSSNLFPLEGYTSLKSQSASALAPFSSTKPPFSGNSEDVANPMVSGYVLMALCKRVLMYSRKLLLQRISLIYPHSLGKEDHSEKKKMVPMLQVLVNLHERGKQRGLYVRRPLPSPLKPPLAPKMLVTDNYSVLCRGGYIHCM